MKKEQFQEKYSKAIDANYDALNPYIERGLTIFEIESVKQEILNCLMVNLYQASIALTNHLLERGLKLALIHNEVGIVPLPIEEWSTKFPEPNKRYGSLNLNKAIELCIKESLLLEDERKLLMDTIREQFRNGFSHADMTQILKDFPSTGTFHFGNFTNPGVITQIELPQTAIHVLQPLLQEGFAKQNALLYFKYVYKLLINIEKRLTTKFKQ